MRVPARPWEDIETASRAELEALQRGRLRELLAYAHERQPFYRRAWEETGVEWSAIEHAEQLAELPFTRKSDLRDNYPFGLFAVPGEQVARVHGSSGTTGKPTIVGYTRGDLEIFAAVVARCLAMAGARPGMTLHNAYGYGLFTGGLGVHGGAEKLGMTVVPVSGGMTERQITLLLDLQPEFISVTPSYALTLCEALADRGIEPDRLSLRYATLGAEPWTERMRAEIDRGLGVRSTNIYGLSEIIGPGVSNECVEARNGAHLNEDHFLPEIVDPETLRPLPAGEEGVLVTTTLTKRALPLIRYWTGDVTRLDYEQCQCGRTLVRMAPITGRTDDMLIIRGVNVYPSQVADLVGGIAGLSSHHRLVVRRRNRLDEVEVEVEADPAGAGDGEWSEDLGRRLTARIKDTIGCSMAVSVMAPGSVPRSEGGKIQRVLDLREG